MNNTRWHPALNTIYYTWKILPPALIGNFFLPLCLLLYRGCGNLSKIQRQLALVKIFFANKANCPFLQCLDNELHVPETELTTSCIGYVIGHAYHVTILFSIR